MESMDDKIVYIENVDSHICGRVKLNKWLLGLGDDRIR